MLELLVNSVLIEDLKQMNMKMLSWPLITHHQTIFLILVHLREKILEVEIFINIYEIPFNYYVNFYSAEKKKKKKKVELFEAHLGLASNWYSLFLGKSQKLKSNAFVILRILEIQIKYLPSIYRFEF